MPSGITLGAPVYLLVLPIAFCEQSPALLEERAGPLVQPHLLALRELLPEDPRDDALRLFQARLEPAHGPPPESTRIAASASKSRTMNTPIAKRYRATVVSRPSMTFSASFTLCSSPASFSSFFSPETKLACARSSASCARTPRPAMSWSLGHARSAA